MHCWAEPVTTEMLRVSKAQLYVWERAHPQCADFRVEPNVRDVKI